jgi:energy-coupling factor transporter ATP-binding protein EcfA2
VSSLLEVRDLSVSFTVEGRAVPAVRRVSFAIERGESMALVGESGSGKSVTALSIMQLLPYPIAHHPSGSILFQGRELVGAPEAAMQRVRGDRCVRATAAPAGGPAGGAWRVAGGGWRQPVTGGRVAGGGRRVRRRFCAGRRRRAPPRR